MQSLLVISLLLAGVRSVPCTPQQHSSLKFKTFLNSKSNCLGSQNLPYPATQISQFSNPKAPQLSVTYQYPELNRFPYFTPQIPNSAKHYLPSKYPQSQTPEFSVSNNPKFYTSQTPQFFTSKVPQFSMPEASKLSASYDPYFSMSEAPKFSASHVPPISKSKATSSLTHEASQYSVSELPKFHTSETPQFSVTESVQRPMHKAPLYSIFRHPLSPANNIPIDILPKKSSGPEIMRAPDPAVTVTNLPLPPTSVFKTPPRPIDRIIEMKPMRVPGTYVTLLPRVISESQTFPVTDIQTDLAVRSSKPLQQQFTRCYTEPEQKGRCTYITTAVPKLSLGGFDNQIQSVLQAGMWLYYEENDYNGFTSGRVFYAIGNYLTLTFPPQYRNIISSVRPIGGKNNEHGDMIIGYHGEGFTGPEQSWQDSDDDVLKKFGKISSLIIIGLSPWTLYSEEHFTGNCVCAYSAGCSRKSCTNYDTLGMYTNITTLPFPVIKSIRRGCKTRFGVQPRSMGVDSQNVNGYYGRVM